jgi:hypothetical protein
MAFFSRPGRGKADSNQKSTTASAQKNQSFRGVEVVPHPKARCAAVEQIVGYRILADEAPPLPLPDCDEPVCRCRFAHYRDRRTDLRRDADVGIGTVAAMLNTNDVRSDAPGRRAADREED